MPISSNVSGTWKNATPYVNVSGTWKQAQVYVNVSGVWKLVSGYGIPSVIDFSTTTNLPFAASVEYDMVFLNNLHVGLADETVAVSTTNNTFSSAITSRLNNVNYVASSGFCNGGGKLVFAAANQGGGNSVVFISTDNGLTWNLYETASVGTAGLNNIVYFNSLYIGSTNSGVFSSSDGQTWTSRLSTHMFGSVSIANGMLVAAFGYRNEGLECFQTKIHTSTNGTTWTLAYEGNTDHGVACDPVMYSGGNYILPVYLNQFNISRVYRSTNLSTFTDCGFATDKSLHGGVIDNTILIFSGETNQYKYSLNGGVNWTSGTYTPFSGSSGLAPALNKKCHITPNCYGYYYIIANTNGTATSPILRL